MLGEVWYAKDFSASVVKSLFFREWGILGCFEKESDVIKVAL